MSTQAVATEQPRPVARAPADQRPAHPAAHQPLAPAAGTPEVKLLAGALDRLERQIADGLWDELYYPRMHVRGLLAVALTSLAAAPHPARRRLAVLRARASALRLLTPQDETWAEAQASSRAPAPS
jgi:hypothetical protein